MNRTSEEAKGCICPFLTMNCMAERCMAWEWRVYSVRGSEGIPKSGVCLRMYPEDLKMTIQGEENVSSR